MKAAVHTRYGSSDVVQLSEIPRPDPGDDEILIQVRAASVNDFDWGLISGKPYFIRLFLGLRKPKITISGCDIAGTVVETGKQVIRWRVGDQVFGDLSGGRFGGFAEFVCCREDQVARKPDSLSFLDAAGIPQAAVLAWQALMAGKPLQDGQQILINGAGGGVGTYGVQLAKRKHVEVTGVDSAEKHDMMRSVGFDKTIDYRTTDFTSTGNRYDLIVDTKTNRWPGAYIRSLKPGGTYATVGGNSFKFVLLLLAGPLYSLLTGKSLKLISLKPNLELDTLANLAVSGKLRTVIDGPYKFRNFDKAFDHFLSARHQGKVLIDFDE